MKAVCLARYSVIWTVGTWKDCRQEEYVLSRGMLENAGAAEAGGATSIFFT